MILRTNQLYPLTILIGPIEGQSVRRTIGTKRII